MGVSLSKVFQNDSPCSKSPRPEYLTDDPRSPSENIQRTPIAVSLKQYLETDIDNYTPPPRKIPLRMKVLRKSLDPRSPSAGINRTPLPIGNQMVTESPVSLYSNNFSAYDSMTLLPSPCEPSINVSDFADEVFAQELDELVDQLEKSWNVNEQETAGIPQPLGLSNKSNSDQSEKLKDKQFCEDLIKEIIDSFKECEETTLEPLPRVRKVKKLVLSSNNSTPSTPKKTSLKARKPFANISHISNTPTKSQTKPTEKLVKVAMLGENSPSTPLKQIGRAQWDMDTTILI